MTPLERAARAIVAELVEQVRQGRLWLGDDDDLTEVTVDGHVDLIAVVRAVLLSIREPSEGMIDAAVAEDPDDVQAQFRAMIDAALGEGDDFDTRNAAREGDGILDATDLPTGPITWGSKHRLGEG